MTARASLSSHGILLFTLACIHLWSRMPRAINEYTMHTEYVATIAESIAFSAEGGRSTLAVGPMAPVPSFHWRVSILPMV